MTKIADQRDLMLTYSVGRTIFRTRRQGMLFPQGWQVDYKK